MTYTVLIQPRAERDIEEAYRWRREQAPAAANRWLTGLRQKIATLATDPARCSLADESDAFGEEVRQLLYGKRRGVYRVLFVIREDTVRVLAVRHSARGPLEP
jgi:plasmid stabilization system protein ParE